MNGSLIRSKEARKGLRGIVRFFDEVRLCCRIVKQMEADGLVTRRPDPADNRFTLVQLTEAGCALQEDIIAKLQRADATLVWSTG